MARLPPSEMPGVAVGAGRLMGRAHRRLRGWDQVRRQV